VVAVVLAVALAGCVQELASSPLGPCGDDARAVGGFRELEALLPASLGAANRAPDRVDSGRSCSDAALSTLKLHGVTELRFAGATWEDSDSEATVVAVLATPSWVPPLEEAWVEEWYEQGARTARKTDNIETSRPSLGQAGEVFRLDTINDLSFQTVVTWQDGGRTHVVIVASDVAPGKERAAHDAKVLTAVQAVQAVEVVATPPPS
jgi:hypothetical protein